MEKTTKKPASINYDNFIETHGKDKLRTLELPTDDLGNDHIEVLVKIPTRRVMSQYMKYVDGNPNKAQEILVKECVLTKKDEILADDALFMTTVGLLAELIPIREGRIKKL